MRDKELRPVGKDIRAWLRENTPEDVAPMPLSDMINIACEDAPYNNRTGTWPLILIKWLPYFLDNEQYKQSYALIETSFRYTNAVQDQKNWASTLLNLAPPIRRTVFKQLQSLLIEAMHTTGSDKSLLCANMKGLFEDPSWFEPQWFDKWIHIKTMEILTHTGTMDKSSACLLHQWFLPKCTMAERLTKWSNAVDNVYTHNPIQAEKLMFHLFKAWDILLYNTHIGSNYLKLLTDDQLLKVANETNITLLKKNPKKTSHHEERLRDLIEAWLQRPQSSIDWTHTWRQLNKNELTPIGERIFSYLNNWTNCVKDKRLGPAERKLLLLNILVNEKNSNLTVPENILEQEDISPYIRDIISSLGLSGNDSLNSILKKMPPTESSVITLSGLAE